jgi:hypothetical protein
MQSHFVCVRVCVCVRVFATVTFNLKIPCGDKQIGRMTVMVVATSRVVS